MKPIHCKNLSKHYSSGFSTKILKTALSGVDFDVEPNEIFGLIGPNGAGKSTLLKILMGFCKPSMGSAVIFGRPAGNPSIHEKIGYLPENPTLYKNLTITDHLLMACRMAKLPPKKSTEMIGKVLEIVNLENSRNTPIKNYSKGMVQRAALANALLLEPELLILDEPMSGLDPLGRRLVIDIIHEYNRNGSTILFSSHILNDVESICDKISVINNGSLVATTTPKELSSYSENTSEQKNSTPIETFFLDAISRTDS